VPSHCYRMRVFGRDLIRGGHYLNWLYLVLYTLRGEDAAYVLRRKSDIPDARVSYGTAEERNFL
jgi:hypothetical protein